MPGSVSDMRASFTSISHIGLVHQSSSCLTKPLACLVALVQWAAEMRRLISEEFGTGLRSNPNTVFKHPICSTSSFKVFVSLASPSKASIFLRNIWALSRRSILACVARSTNFIKAETGESASPVIAWWGKRREFGYLIERAGNCSHSWELGQKIDISHDELSVAPQCAQTSSLARPFPTNRPVIRRHPQTLLGDLPVMNR